MDRTRLCDGPLLWLVLGLTLDEPGARTRVAAALPGAPADDWRTDAILQWLVERALHAPEWNARVRAALDEELRETTERYWEGSLYDLMNAWAGLRDCATGKELAGLLWAVAARPDPAFHRFQERVIVETYLRGLRGLCRSTRREGDPFRRPGRDTRPAACVTGVG